MADVTEHAGKNQLVLPVRYRSGEVFGNKGEFEGECYRTCRGKSVDVTCEVPVGRGF